jgi:hypothetical protein
MTQDADKRRKHMAYMDDKKAVGPVPKIDPKTLARIWPQGGYAPGNYHCKCSHCGNTFIGDKRAFECHDCVIKALAARVAELEAYNAANLRIIAQTADDAAKWKSRAEAAEAKLAAKEAETEKLRDALTGIKRAGQARMASYGDEHSYYYFTASAALQETGR